MRQGVAVQNRVIRPLDRSTNQTHEGPCFIYLQPRGTSCVTGSNVTSCIRTLAEPTPEAVNLNVNNQMMERKTPGHPWGEQMEIFPIRIEHSIGASIHWIRSTQIMLKHRKPYQFFALRFTEKILQKSIAIVIATYFKGVTLLRK